MKKLSPTIFAAILTLLPYCVLPSLTRVGWSNSLEMLIDKIINIITALAGVVLVIFLIWGGITYITAAGNEEQSGKGKKIVFDAIIGIVIVGAAFALAKYVMGILNLGGPGLAE